MGNVMYVWVYGVTQPNDKLFVILTSGKWI